MDGSGFHKEGQHLAAGWQRLAAGWQHLAAGWQHASAGLRKSSQDTAGFCPELISIDLLSIIPI
jgi:hypothetical protein